jgi:hypothetical protein
MLKNESGLQAHGFRVNQLVENMLGRGKQTVASKKESSTDDFELALTDLPQNGDYPGSGRNLKTII